jgi:N-acetylneuraminic acid mutarotase
MEVVSTGVPSATSILPPRTPDGSDFQSAEPNAPTSVPLPVLPRTVNPGFSMAIPRTQHTATLLENGNILIAGGSVEGDDFACDEELINPITGESSWTAPLHTVRHGHSATLLPNGRVLVVGGYNLPEQWIDDAEVYDTQLDVWTIIPPHHSHGTGHSATRLKDGRVLIVGGCISSGVCTNIVETFDPSTNLWKEAASMQADRWGQTSQLLENGRLLIAGGVTAAGDTPADGSALIYDPSHNTWGITKSMNTPNFLAQSVKLNNGEVLVAGGFLSGSHPPEISNEVEIYDPDTNTWRTVAPLSNPRYAFTLKLLPNGQVIAISGAREWDNFWTQDSFVKEIELFDPAVEQWHVIGELPEPSAFATGTQLNNGTIWIAGGQVGDLVADKTWLIRP